MYMGGLIVMEHGEVTLKLIYRVKFDFIKQIATVLDAVVNKTLWCCQ